MKDLKKLMVEEDVVEDNVNNETGTVIESDDVSKWEMETEPHLDKIYHKLIGYSENSNGGWTRDTNLSRCMNELGASEFIQEYRARFNINMQMSELQMEDIKKYVC